MLGSDDDAYLTARTLQFFVPGIPQVIMLDYWRGKTMKLTLQEPLMGGR